MSAVGRFVTLMLVMFQDYWSPKPDSHLDPGEFVGLVLARQGSKGIPRKNMAILNGHPLIHYVLEAMIQSEIFDSIWVSTDDSDLKEYVLQTKKDVQVHDRAWFTATDEATSMIAIQEFLKFHPEVGRIALVQATSPFVKPEYLVQGRDTMDLYKLDSVFSATRQKKLRWSHVTLDDLKSGYYPVALNFDAKHRPRRQEWAGEVEENGMFYIFRKKNIMEGVIQGKRSYYVEIPKHDSLEIDKPEDLTLANILMSSEFKDVQLPPNPDPSTHQSAADPEPEETDHDDMELDSLKTKNEL